MKNKCIYCIKPFKRKQENQILCHSCNVALRKNNLKVDIYLERKSRENLRGQIFRK